MTKKEFETTDEPLCMIVSLDPSSGKVLYDTYDWRTQDRWLEDFRKDFPKMMHFSTLNPAAIREKRRCLDWCINGTQHANITNLRYIYYKKTNPSN